MINIRINIIYESMEFDDDQFDNQTKDDLHNVFTVKARMGSEELKVRDLIVQICKPYINNQEMDRDNAKEMSLVEQAISVDITNTLNERFGGWWGAIVGNRFSIGIGLKETDKYGNFKIGIFNVVVYQLNINRDS